MTALLNTFSGTTGFIIPPAGRIAKEKIPSGQKERPREVLPRGALGTGNTYFRSVSTIIGSESLTSVFGMGTGG
ncbi:MAG: hypothetical protein IJJ20_08710, partial [Thermoguttaceae bacterium]|nr:hypothetical protein [Thermoguttaceae bacterium]